MLQAFNPLSRLMPWSTRALRTMRAPRRAATYAATHAPKPLPALADEVNEGSTRCGWFDSSHELQSGLMVLEHAGPDSLVDLMPPGPWLDLYAALPSNLRC